MEVESPLQVLKRIYLGKKMQILRGYNIYMIKVRQSYPYKQAVEAHKVMRHRGSNIF
jgi:hypothetical protein